MKIKLLILLNLIALNCYGLDPAVEKNLRDAIVSDGDRAVASILKENGVDVNSTLSGESRSTLLGYAVQKGAKKVAKFLIEKGANIDSMDKFDQSPLKLAMKYKRYDIAKFLIENKAQVSSSILELILLNNFLDLAELLVNQGVNFSESLGDGVEKLSKSKEMRDLLNSQIKQFEKEEMRKAISKKNSKPLIFAIYEGNLNLVRFAFENGAKLLEKDDKGKTLFDRYINISGIFEDLSKEMQELLLEQKKKEEEEQQKAATAGYKKEDAGDRKE